MAPYKITIQRNNQASTNEDSFSNPLIGAETLMEFLNINQRLAIPINEVREILNDINIYDAIIGIHPNPAYLVFGMNHYFNFQNPSAQEVGETILAAFTTDLFRAFFNQIQEAALNFIQDLPNPNNTNAAIMEFLHNPAEGEHHLAPINLFGNDPTELNEALAELHNPAGDEVEHQVTPINLFGDDDEEAPHTPELQNNNPVNLENTTVAAYNPVIANNDATQPLQNAAIAANVHNSPISPYSLMIGATKHSPSDFSGDIPANDDL